MNKKTQSKLVTAAKEVLATFCWKDEKGYFYEEIYADYRDELDDGSLKKDLRSRTSAGTFLGLAG